MEFRLAEGPWKEMFKGVFEDYGVEIYSNPESIILVSILEKEADVVKGAVVELYKVFSAKGELQGFIESLPREVLAIIKHDEKQTQSFFILGNKPSYVKYEEDPFANEVEDMLKKIGKSTKMLLDVSKAYDLVLQPLHEAPEDIKTAFFSQPLIVPLLSTSSHAKYITAEENAIQEPGKVISFGELILGMTKDGLPVKEPLSLFSSAIVAGGDKKDRLHALHLIIEGALLSNLPAVVIDWENHFEGLGKKSTLLDKLKEYKVELDPMGFPVKEFYIPQQLRVDLNIVDKKGMLQSFGLEETIAGRGIINAMEENRIASLVDAAKAIRKFELKGGFNEFERNRAVRLIKLMGLRYPELFDGENNIEEVSKSRLGGMGRAGIVHMEGHDARVSLLMTHSLVRDMLEYYKKQGPSKQLRSLLVVPDAVKVLPNMEDNRLVKEIVKDLTEMQQYGVGFALEVDRGVVLDDTLLKMAEARLNIVRGNDVSIQLKGRKNYRVLLRPGLSECTENKE